MGDTLGIQNPNDRQWIVTVYLLGFGAAQLIYGTLADRFGRKPVLMAGFVIYVLGSILAVFTSSFEMILLARVIQGSAPRRRGCWRSPSCATAIPAAHGAGDVAGLHRVPRRADHGARRRPGDHVVRALAGIFGAARGVRASARGALGGDATARDAASRRTACRSRSARSCRRSAPCSTTGSPMGYMLAMTFVMGGLFGFINSAQQVFVDVFHAAHLFTTDLRPDRGLHRAGVAAEFAHRRRGRDAAGLACGAARPISR